MRRVFNETVNPDISQDLNNISHIQEETLSVTEKRNLTGVSKHGRRNPKKHRSSSLLFEGWKRRRSFVTALAGIVLFTTIYSLILPAASMTSQTATEEAGFFLDEGDESESVAEVPSASVTQDSGIESDGQQAPDDDMDAASGGSDSNITDVNEEIAPTEDTEQEDASSPSEGTEQTGITAPAGETEQKNADVVQAEETDKNADAAAAEAEQDEDNKAEDSKTESANGTQQSEDVNTAGNTTEGADSVQHPEDNNNKSGNTAESTDNTQQLEDNKSAGDAADSTDSEQHPVEKDDDSEGTDKTEEQKITDDSEGTDLKLEDQEKQEDDSEQQAKDELEDVNKKEEAEELEAHPVFIDSAEAENAAGVHALVHFAEDAGVLEGTVLTIETVESTDGADSKTETYKRIEDAMTAYVARENGINRDDIIVDDVYAVRLSLVSAEGGEVSFEGDAKVVIDYPIDIELEDDRFFAVFDDDIKAVPAEIYRESGRTTISFTTSQLGLTGYYLAEEKIPVYENGLSWTSGDGSFTVDVEFEEGAKIPENSHIEVTLTQSDAARFPLNARSLDEANTDEAQDDEWNQITDKVLSYLDEKLEKSALESGEYSEGEELPWNELDYAKLLEIHIYDEEGDEVSPEDASKMHVRLTMDPDTASFEAGEDDYRNLSDVREATYGEDETAYSAYILRDNKEYYDFTERFTEEHPEEEIEIPEDLYSLEEADTSFEQLYDEQGDNYALTAEYNIEMSGFMGILVSHVEIPVVYVNELSAISDDRSLEFTVALPEDAEVEEGAALRIEQVFGNDCADGSDRTWNESARDLIAEQMETDPENVEIVFSRLYRLYAEDKDGNELSLENENWSETAQVSLTVNRSVETSDETVIRFFRTMDATLTEDELADVTIEDRTLKVEYQPAAGETAGVIVFNVHDTEMSDDAESIETEDDDPDSVSGNSAEDTPDADQAGVSGNDIAGENGEDAGVSRNDGAGDGPEVEGTEEAETGSAEDIPDEAQTEGQDENSIEKDGDYMQGTLTDGAVTLTFDASAQIPQGTVLTVTPEYDLQYIEKLQRLLENEETKLLYARVYSVHLDNNGEAVIPATSMTVTIHTSDTVTGETGRAVVKYVDGFVERIAARDESANPGFFESLTGTNGLTFTFDTWTGTGLTIGTAVTGDLTDENRYAPINLAVAQDSMENMPVSDKDAEDSAEDNTIKLNYAHELTAVAEGVTVTAIMGDEAGIPEGSFLTVRLIEESSSEYKNLVKRYNQANPDRPIDTEPTVTETIGDFFSGLMGNEKAQPASQTQAKFVDITIIDPEGKEIEPGDKVKVDIRFEDTIEASGTENVSVVHFEDQKKVKSLTAEEHQVELSVSDAGESASETENFENSGIENANTSVDVTDTVTMANDVTTANKVSVDGVSFMTEGFSVYGIVFTIDVSLINFVGDGENVLFVEGSYTLDGGNSVSLKTLLTELGVINAEEAEAFVASNIKAVTFTKADAVEIKQIEETVSNGILGIGKEVKTVDWTITPLKLFTSTEYLMLERMDGEKACIRVEATGVEEVQDNFATISTADGRILPTEAAATADILEGDAAAQAKAVVEAFELQNKDEGVLALIKEFASYIVSNNIKAADKKEYRVFDIDLQNVEIENYEDGFKVNVEFPFSIAGTDFALHHIHEGIVEEIPVEIIGKVTENGSIVASGFMFKTADFSEFVLSYTVDFSYSVNGKMYQFSIPGGGFVSFTDLVEVLGINSDTYFAENASKNESEANDKDTEVVPLTLDDVVVSEATRKFVANVENVEFSSPELVWVGKVDDDSTVGVLKEVNELECRYSTELTEEQIAEINTQIVEAGDWALISMQPFNTEETLTVTMINGDIFTIQVTDAQITRTVITADGQAYKVTVTYDSRTEIPDDADLVVEEITEGSSLYDTYVTHTENALGMKEGGAEYIRLFDIKIVDKDDPNVKYQPAEGSKVDVKIELADAESDSLRVVHFAEGEEEGEIIESFTENDVDRSMVEFQADSFSVYSIVDAPEPVNYTSPGWHTANSLDQIEELGKDGFYVSWNMYYLTGGLIHNVSGNSDRDGLSATSIQYNSVPEDQAAKFYFTRLEGTDTFKIYVEGEGDTKKYVKMTSVSGNTHRAGLTFVDEESDGTAFTIEKNGNNSNFYISSELNNKEYWWNRNTNATGGVGAFAAYDGKSDKNTAIVTLNYYVTAEQDPYELDGKTFGIAYNDNSTTAAAMMAESSTQNRLNGLDMLIRNDVLNNNGNLLVAENSDIQEWTFESVEEDKYYIKTTVGGSEKYLHIQNGNVKLVDDWTGASMIKATPGTGSNSGKWHFTVNNYSLNYAGSNANNFNAANNSNASTWLNLVEKSTLTDDDFVEYHAHKISASDDILSATEKDDYGNILKDGDGNPVYRTEKTKVIVYTRVWNETTKKYEFYALDHNGSLIRVYDSGDQINWVGNQVNSALWEFTEYTNNDGTPTYFYELENTAYAGTYLAPQSDGIISHQTVGINLNGRRDGFDYTSVVAWDDPAYAYSGLKIERDENGSLKAVTCSLDESADFHFAVMARPVEEAGSVTPVTTVDNDEFGISIKMIDFNNAITGGRDSVQIIWGQRRGIRLMHMKRKQDWSLPI